MHFYYEMFLWDPLACAEILLLSNAKESHPFSKVNSRALEMGGHQFVRIPAEGTSSVGKKVMDLLYVMVELAIVI